MEVWFGIHLDWCCNAVIGSLLAWMILGRRTRVMTQHLDSKTMPDFFGLRFGSNGLKIIASIIVFIFLFISLATAICITKEAISSPPIIVC